MTTLPKSFPMRLPPPNGGASVGPHGAVAQGVTGHLGPAQATGAAGPHMTGADAWRVIRSHFWLIIIMGIVSAAAGYGINTWLKLYHSRYTAMGTLEATLPTGDTLEGSNPVAMDSVALNVDMKTDEALLQEPSLVARVLENPDSPVRQTAWFKSFNTIQDAKEDLDSNFGVAIQPDSRLLRVTMTNRDPESCVTVVKSFADEYIKEQEELNRDKTYGLNRDLENRRAVEENKIKVVGSDIAELEADLNASGVTGTQNRISAKDIELSQLLDNIIKLQVEEGTAEDQYNSIVQQINAGQDPPDATKLIYQDPEVYEDRQLVSQMDVSIADAMGAEGAENPHVKDLKERQKLLQEKLDGTIAEARVRYRTAVTEEAHEKVISAQREVEQMQKRVDQLRSDMGQLTDLMTRLLQKEDEKEGYEQRLKKIDDELDQITSYSVQRDFAGVEWAAYPELPDVPSFPKLPVTMSLAITLGVALTVGGAFLKELMDTSIRSPRDLNRVGSMNLLGMVPHQDDDREARGARLPLVIFEAPHSMLAEQFRQVRTRLQHAAALESMRSILVTSPSPSDGKTTVAVNLASGLALNGRRILLVDANFRRPELHKIFNIGNDRGFSSALNNLDSFEQAIQQTQVPNLFVLPAGPKPANATELLESQLLSDFVDRVLEEFDHVIFDSGPMLLVSETVALAPRVDGVVTVVRARNNSRGLLTRLRESLRQVKAEHLGVVLNGVRAQGGGYYGRNIRTYYKYQNGHRA